MGGPVWKVWKGGEIPTPWPRTQTSPSPHTASESPKPSESGILPTQRSPGAQVLCVTPASTNPSPSRPTTTLKTQPGGNQNGPRVKQGRPRARLSHALCALPPAAPAQAGAPAPPRCRRPPWPPRPPASARAQQGVSNTASQVQSVLHFVACVGCPCSGRRMDLTGNHQTAPASLQQQAAPGASPGPPAPACPLPRPLGCPLASHLSPSPGPGGPGPPGLPTLPAWSRPAWGLPAHTVVTLMTSSRLPPWGLRGS